jgi:hypothetical protein
MALHKHKCECGQVWEHSSADRRAENFSHACPACGAEEFEYAFEEDAVTVCHTNLINYAWISDRIPVARWRKWLGF